MNLNFDLDFKKGVVAGVICFFGFVLMCQYLLWYVALAFIVVWSPFAFRYAIDLLKRDCTLCIYFILVALQSVHMMEHVAQMVQIHILGWMFKNSHGLFGAAFDVELLHFLFDSVWIPFWTIYLIYVRRDIWMIIMLPLALLHCAEHIVIMDYYLKTGIVGSPGIMAMGGLVGSPLSRPDLHFWYNALETLAMIVGFRKAIKQ